MTDDSLKEGFVIPDLIWNPGAGFSILLDPSVRWNDGWQFEGGVSVIPGLTWCPGVDGFVIPGLTWNPGGGLSILLDSSFRWNDRLQRSPG